MATDLAKLVVKLEAESSKLTTELQKANQKLSSFERGAKRSASAVKGIFAGLVAGFSIDALVGGIRNATDSLSKIADQADKLGLTTDALQELRFAAEQAGVKVESFDIGFQRFTRRAADAAAGNEALAKTFRDFNIELTGQDGRLKTNEALFLEFADAIKASDDQGKRILKTFQLLDTEGVDLVRLLQQGSGAVEGFRDRARSMGAVIDADLIQRSREADRQLDALSRVIGAQLKPALAELAPVLVSVAESFATAAHWVAQFFDRFRDAKNKTSLEGIRDRMKEIRNEIAAFPNTPPSLFQLGELEDLSKRYDELTQQIGKPLEQFGGLAGGGPAVSGIEKTTKAVSEMRDEFDVAFDLIDAQFRELDDQWARGFTGLEKITEQVVDVKKETADISEGARSLGITFSSSFERAITEGEKFRDVLQGILKDILAIIARKVVTEPLGNYVTSAISGAFPGFASGTSFAPGGLAVVGESGPELVNLPRGSQVIPNQQLGGITINVDARGSTDPAATARTVKQAVGEAVSTIRGMKSRGMLPEFA